MRRCIAPGTATDYTNVNSLPGRNIGDGQVSERDDFQVQQGARLDQEAKGVKERETTDARLQAIGERLQPQLTQYLQSSQ